LDTVLRLAVPGETSFPFALVAAAAASVLGLVVFEVSLRRYASCSTKLWGPSARITLLVGSFVTGLLVIYPGTGIVGSTAPVFRVVSAFGVACVAASVGHHVGSEHSDRVSPTAVRLLAALMRTPLWVLVGIFVLLLVAGIGEIVYAALGY
jgi:hypothetical protein